MFPTANSALPPTFAAHSLPAVQAEPMPESIGCGWFESSRELVQGIKVIEHEGFEALSFEVPLAWQLAACC